MSKFGWQLAVMLTAFSATVQAFTFCSTAAQNPASGAQAINVGVANYTSRNLQVDCRYTNASNMTCEAMLAANLTNKGQSNIYSMPSATVCSFSDVNNPQITASATITDDGMVTCADDHGSISCG